MKRFESYHPVVTFLFFVFVLFITMFSTNPIIIGISFISSIVFYMFLCGFMKVLNSFKFTIPMLLILAITNPLFSHKGETILFFMNDNPITLEAIIYGIFMSMMMISVYYWFCCFNEIMTSDKILFLFGRISPKISLLFSMILGFIPKFKKQYQAIEATQTSLGLYSSNSIYDKVKGKMRILSMIITWSFENSMDSASSMKARGYGLKKRTSYSIYDWIKRDYLLLFVLLLLSSIILYFFINKIDLFYFYPSFSRDLASYQKISMYIVVSLLMFIPSLLELKEVILWKYLKSKI